MNKKVKFLLNPTDDGCWISKGDYFTDAIIEFSSFSMDELVSIFKKEMEKHNEEYVVEELENGCIAMTIL